MEKKTDSCMYNNDDIYTKKSYILKTYILQYKNKMTVNWHSPLFHIIIFIHTRQVSNSSRII